jgi:hypothetical protein
MDLSNKFLIIHPAAFYLGWSIIILGVLAVIAGAVSYFGGQVFFPASIWFAAAVPTIGVGGSFVACAMTRP